MAQGTVSTVKNPPALHDGIEYVAWKKEIEIWKICCKYEKKEMAPIVTLSLKGSAREAAREMSIADLNADDGMEKLITKLDGLYLKDEKQRKYICIKSFTSFTRQSSQSLDSYINEFERHYNKIKSLGVNLGDDFVAYRLLESANLSKPKSELVRTTINNLAFDDMKKQLRKLEDVVLQDTSDVVVKSENDETFYGSHHRGRDMSSSRSSSHSRGVSSSRSPSTYRGGSSFRGAQSRGGSSRGRGRVNASRRGGFRTGRNGYRRGRGVCYNCNGSDHYIDQCPILNEHTGYEDESEVLHSEDNYEEVEQIALSW